MLRLAERWLPGGLTMTKEVLAKANALKEEIDRLLSESEYLYYKGAEKEGKHITSFDVNMSYNHGGEDFLFEIPDELLVIIQQWYSDKIEALETELESL